MYIESMVNIDEITPEIVNSLKPLNPDKIILFGSYAYGNPDDESDIDLFLLKNDLLAKNARDYRVNARLSLRKLVNKYKIGFDILSARTSELNKRQDYFYKVDILQNGKVLYERNSG